MINKRFEIESMVEEIIENRILEEFSCVFENQLECEIALEILKEKLDEFDPKVFKDLFE